MPRGTVSAPFHSLRSECDCVRDDGRPQLWNQVVLRLPLSVLLGFLILGQLLAERGTVQVLESGVGALDRVDDRASEAPAPSPSSADGRETGGSQIHSMASLQCAPGAHNTRFQASFTTGPNCVAPAHASSAATAAQPAGSARS